MFDVFQVKGDHRGSSGVFSSDSPVKLEAMVTLTVADITVIPEGSRIFLIEWFLRVARTLPDKELGDNSHVG